MQLGASLPRNHSSDNYFRASRGSAKTSHSAKRSYNQDFNLSNKLKQTTPKNINNAFNLPKVSLNQEELISQFRHQVKSNFHVKLDPWDKDGNLHGNNQFQVTDSFKSNPLKTHRRTQTLQNPTIQDQYTPRKTFNLQSQASSRKEKISMDQFIFGAQPTGVVSPLHRNMTVGSPRQTEAFQFAATNNYQYPSVPATTRNPDLVTAFSPRPTTTYNENEGVFKTSIGVDAGKNPKQALKEIRRLGNFRVNKIESMNGLKMPSSNVISSQKSLANSEYNSRRADGAFKIKKNTIICNRESIRKLQQQQQSGKEGKEKIDIDELLSTNKKNILVCAHTERGFFHFQTLDLKYCFIEREKRKSFTPRASQSLKGDVAFNIKINSLQKKLNLPDSYKYIYLLNGHSIFDFQMVPLSQKVLIISNDKNAEERDLNQMMEFEIIRKFLEYTETKREYTTDLTLTMDLDQDNPLNNTLQQVLNIVENTYQLNSQQLEKLVGLSSRGKPKEFFSKAVQGAFLNPKIGSVIADEDRGSIFSEKGYLKAGQAAGGGKDSRRSSLEALMFPRIENLKRGTVQEIAHEEEVEKYVKSKKLLKENKKITDYKKVVKEYDKGLKVIKMKHTEEDFDLNLGYDPKDIIESNKEKAFAKKNRVDEKLERLLKKWNGKKGKDQDKDQSDSDDTIAMINSRNRSDAGLSPKKLQRTESIGFNKSDVSDHIAEPDLEFKKDPVAKSTVKNFIQENAKPINKKKEFLRQLDNRNRDLYTQNIPKLIKDINLTREEIHSVYSLYKTLAQVTSQRYKNYNINDGIDYNTFKNGVYSNAMQTEEVASRIFYAVDKNFSGYLDWKEFLEVMVTMRAKTLHEKIDLFIKVADLNGNGNLSRDEIYSLCKICLSKFIKNTPDGYLDELCFSFTNIIFDTLGYDFADATQEIPLEAIKAAVFAGNAESNLLAMFCGADV